MEDVKNFLIFKLFEEKVENLKFKVGGIKFVGGDFGEVLNLVVNVSVIIMEFFLE